MQNEPIEVTVRVTQVLEKLSIPYLIGGSLASALYGMVRAPQDADIVAEMRWSISSRLFRPCKMIST